MAAQTSRPSVSSTTLMASMRAACCVEPPDKSGVAQHLSVERVEDIAVESDLVVEEEPAEFGDETLQ